MYKLKLEIVKDCNLDCRYCFVTHDKKDMDFNFAKRAVDFGLKRAIECKQNELSITFFGGEPLIKFDLVKELTDYTFNLCEEHSIKPFFDMTTNGVLFNQRIAEFCAEHGFDVKISLDGTPEDHDLNRRNKNGSPTFKQIMRNIKAINFFQQKTNRPIQISMVVSKNTYRNFFENFKYLIGKGFSYIDTQINYKDKWTLEELNILGAGLEKAFCLYLENLKNGHCFRWTFVDYGIMPQIKKRKHYFCRAGELGIFVTTDGLIYPCSGCVKEEALIGNIDQGLIEQKLYRFANYKRNLSHECSVCTIKEYCSICDCILMNLEITDNFYEVPLAFCYLAKARYRLTNTLLNNEELFKKLLRI